MEPHCLQWAEDSIGYSLEASDLFSDLTLQKRLTWAAPRCHPHHCDLRRSSSIVGCFFPEGRYFGGRIYCRRISFYRTSQGAGEGSGKLLPAIIHFGWCHSAILMKFLFRWTLIVLSSFIGAGLHHKIISHQPGDGRTAIHFAAHRRYCLSVWITGTKDIILRFH